MRERNLCVMPTPQFSTLSENTKVSILDRVNLSFVADPASLPGSFEPEEGDVGQRDADQPALRGAAPERNDLPAVVGPPRLEGFLPPRGEVRPASHPPGASVGKLHQDLGHPG